MCFKICIIDVLKQMEVHCFLKTLRSDVRNFLRYFNYHILWRFIFLVNSILPVNKNLVIFADAHSTTLTDNMQCIYDELKKRSGYKFIFCLAPNMSGKKIKDLFAVYFGFIRFCRYYARCRTLILTDSYLPAFACKPRKNTTVIQLWHACGAFKKWGYSTAENDWGADKKALKRYPLHNCYSKVCVSSECIIPFYAQAFNCDESIIEAIGVPRTDIYFDDDFKKSARPNLEKTIPNINGRKIILYAPTFRGVNVKTAHTNVQMDYSALKKAFGDKYVIINKFHPFIENGIDIDNEFKDFVFNSPKEMDISILLCAADVVISDYSSLIFEYSLLARPMIFYAYDLEEYDKERSFYYSYKDFVPGDIVKNTSEIIDAIKNIETDFDVERVNEFCEKFMSACDGKSTQHVLNWIK